MNWSPTPATVIARPATLPNAAAWRSGPHPRRFTAARREVPRSRSHRSRTWIAAQENTAIVGRTGLLAKQIVLRIA